MRSSSKLSALFATALGLSPMMGAVGAIGFNPVSHPAGRPFLPRGQAPAKGILSNQPRKVVVKDFFLSRRDMQRMNQLKRVSRPDFSAQIAREAKQERGRAARQRRAAGI